MRAYIWTYLRSGVDRRGAGRDSGYMPHLQSSLEPATGPGYDSPVRCMSKVEEMINASRVNLLKNPGDATLPKRN